VKASAAAGILSKSHLWSLDGYNLRLVWREGRLLENVVALKYREAK
jgi:hypothetical protein